MILASALKKTTADAPTGKKTKSKSPRPLDKAKYAKDFVYTENLSLNDKKTKMWPKNIRRNIKRGQFYSISDRNAIEIVYPGPEGLQYPKLAINHNTNVNFGAQNWVDNDALITTVGAPDGLDYGLLDEAIIFGVNNPSDGASFDLPSLIPINRTVLKPFQHATDLYLSLIHI